MLPSWGGTSVFHRQFKKNDLVLVENKGSGLSCVILHDELPDYFHGDLGPFYFCWVIELHSYIVVYEFEILGLISSDFVIDWLPDFDFTNYIDEYDLFEKVKDAFSYFDDE